ncbi:MAG: FAD-dependent oxidoreductase [Patescibacteria group bacterium]|nr:FAD-dependent oxidoreductase [Patescibacteria group bacterium]
MYSPARRLVAPLLFACSLFAAGTVPAAGCHTVLIEAESFNDRGGWVIDQQSMDQMGSPYLLAHGLGVPVADATTTVEIPAAGEYRVLVRTRDWVANWGATGSPGRFQVAIAGKTLPTVFGTEGAEWHWQAAGTVRLDAGPVTLALKDLTGFAGRCDAILLTTDPDLTPPEMISDGCQPCLDEVRAWRGALLGHPATVPDAGEFDLVVVGGGMAGVCTAISAARLGVNVALIQNRPVLGGNNSSEVRVGLSGRIQQEPYPRLGDLVDEIGPVGHHNFHDAKRAPDLPRSKEVFAIIEKHPEKMEHNAGPASNYEDARKLEAVQAEKNLSLFLNMHAVKVEKLGSRIVAVIARHIETGAELRFPAALFADCTGDGTLGFLAGADYRVGREPRWETGESLAPVEPDRLVMGTSVQWYAEQREEPAPFPECPWALPFNEETCHRTAKGDWDWEAGMNMDQVSEIEAIRDHAFRAVYGNWAYLKNHSEARQEFANHRLAWMAHIGGKRESRRLLGDVILAEQDLVEQRPYPDACVTTTWSIDLHYPHPKNSEQFPGMEFRSVAHHKRIEPYPIPFRCLYSRNVENLMMAGRQISVTHVALGTIRVMRTTGMMGEVLGMAASLCKKHETLPRGVYQNHLEELQSLMHRGVGRQ